MSSVRPPEKDIQTALRFLQKSPELFLSSSMTSSEFAALDHGTLAALATSCGYPFQAGALGEAFRIRMLARLLARQRTQAVGSHPTED